MSGRSACQVNAEINDRGEAANPARMLLPHLHNDWHSRGAARQLHAADLVQRHAAVCERLHNQNES